jgi:hypothetical protein
MKSGHFCIAASRRGGKKRHFPVKAERVKKNKPGISMRVKY